MKRSFILIAILSPLFFIPGFVQGQSLLTGKIFNTKNEPLAGVTILVQGTSKGTSSDIEGRFTINNGANKIDGLTFSAIGYKPKTITDFKSGEEVLVILDNAGKSLENVVVRSTSTRKETTGSLIAFQRNTSTVSQVISAEAIKRSPDKNTGEVLKRIPGTSVQEGKYLVVRGLSDRYNQAMLNGILLSSTEPDRKTFSFDIFPSAMVDNIIMNKSFVPELPGEWAGGLVQIQTKEIPTKSFLSVQLGTGFNTQTIGKDFYQYKGGKLDWLGVDDGTRKLPAAIPTKSVISELRPAELNELGKQFRNVWTANPTQAPLNRSFQLNGGFTGKVLGKKAGGVVSLLYNQTNRTLNFDNAIIANIGGDYDLKYENHRYSRDVLAGVMGNFSVQLDRNNQISFKNILNVNSSDYVIQRTGKDFILGPEQGEKVRAEELGFRQNTFFNTQLIGDHNLQKLGVKIKWYGGFNILDQYIPDQRRLFYTQNENNANAPYYALIGLGSSQKSGSLFYSFLNDYIYNTGVNVSKGFDWLGYKQTLKGGYLFQVKDRLFDSRPFFVNTSSNELKQLSPDKIFAKENFGTGANQVQFGELIGKPFRYIANTILNAGYVQLDNQFTEELRMVWGVRVEDYDQIVGSLQQSDERHVHSKVTDVLPGVNITYKPNNNTNIRLSGSQTVVRPEFRELSPFAFYDFELNAQVVGNNQAKRTKVSNFDLRYEIYPRSGELLTAGVFYKRFNNPLEYYFNRTGPATNTFNVQNSKSAVALGAEFEFRKKLDFINEGLRNFTLSGNYSYIYSKVKDTLTLNRPLQGQSPYLINAGLQYDHEKSGFSANLLYNQIGRRILFVGNEAVPDIWENPRPLLDLQIAKKILKNKGEVRLNVSDIFNKRANFYHDLDDNAKYQINTKDVLAISRNYGTNVSITFGYDIK